MFVMKRTYNSLMELVHDMQDRIEELLIDREYHLGRIARLESRARLLQEACDSAHTTIGHYRTLFEELRDDPESEAIVRKVRERITARKH